MGDRQGVRDHHSLTPTQDRGGNPLTGSLPFVSSCADPHRGGETSKPLAASLDDRVTPTRVGKGSGWHSPPTPTLESSPLTWGKDQDGIRPRLRQSGHPHQGGENQVVVLMVAPAWWGCEFWGP
jgi:hypothetical protein